jgi:peroxiredoxin Q/BCP
VRVPALASWQGKIAPGSTVKEPIHIVDLYPTLLRLANADVEQKLPLDGLDVWDTIASGKPSPHREILINAAPTWGALRSGKWKVVINGGKALENFDGEAVSTKTDPASANAELFDVENDPNETNNLAVDHPDLLKALVQRWVEYRDHATPPKSKPKPKDFQSPKVWGESTSGVGVLQTLGRAPDVEAIDENGNIWKSADHLQSNHLVIYFYPADFTGGCTKQACAYRDAKDSLEPLGAKVVGISGDSSENHRKFKAFHQLNFTLLADPEGKIAESFGVPVSKEAKQVRIELYGQNVTFDRSATSKRWTFIVNRAGQIVYRNSEVNAAEDAAKIIEVLKVLRASDQ